MGVNGVLMSLAPIGLVFNIHGLELYGVIYYFVLFAVAIIIWWIPYWAVSSGPRRRAYNCMLAMAISDFEKGDTLERWLGTHRRLHGETLTVLPLRDGRVVPNVEHMTLHGLTLVTAIATLGAYRGGGT